MVAANDPPHKVTPRTLRELIADIRMSLEPRIKALVEIAASEEESDDREWTPRSRGKSQSQEVRRARRLLASERDDAAEGRYRLQGEMVREGVNERLASLAECLQASLEAAKRDDDVVLFTLGEQLTEVCTRARTRSERNADAAAAAEEMIADGAFVELRRETTKRARLSREAVRSANTAQVEVPYWWFDFALGAARLLTSFGTGDRSGLARAQSAIVEPDAVKRSTKEWATHFDVAAEPLRKRLERWRDLHAFDETDWVEIRDHRKGQPRYLYASGPAKRCADALKDAERRKALRRHGK